MKLSINFSNIHAEEIAKTIELEISDKSSLTLDEFRELLNKQQWKDKILDNDHLKTSVVLIVDDEVIQFSNSKDVEINENSQVSFHIMFAGGL